MSELEPTRTYSNPTATERIRAMLDERGVEHEDDEDVTRFFGPDGFEVVMQEDVDGKLDCLTPLYLTPEQAIAATLGKEPDDAAMLKLHDRMNVALLECERALGIEKADGTIVVPFVFEMHNLLEEAATLGPCNCPNNCTDGERTETCHADETDRIECGETIGGRHYDIHIMECSECGRTYEHIFGDYEFCPRCGRKRRDVEE